MTDDEKKAIERINNLIWGFRRKENKQSKFKKDLWGYFKYRDYEATEILLNLIEKQDNKIKFFIENEIVLKEMNRNQMKIIDKQQKEIEEKRIIIFAGAEKVKQLEKGNRSLMESRKKWKDRYYKEKAKNKERDKYNITTLPFEELKEMIEQNKNISIFGKDYISKDKIKEKIKNIEDIYKKEMKPYQTEYGLNVSLLSKKEKEELINKRNGLLIQKITLEELLEEK